MFLLSVEDVEILRISFIAVWFVEYSFQYTTFDDLIYVLTILLAL